MLRFAFNEYLIELANDPTHTPGSADNVLTYTHMYRLDDGEYAPSSRHSVRVLTHDTEDELASCILIAAGGASGVHDHSALVNDGSLVVAVGPFLVSLRLPTLELNWQTQTDYATCFGVYGSDRHRCYISHGELEVARVSYTGEIEWSHGGADIFTNGFSVTDDRVEAIDWNNDVYMWDIGTGDVLPITGNKAPGPPDATPVR